MKRLLIATILMVLAAPAGALADGQSDYRAKCAGCHGANAMANRRKAKTMKFDLKKLALTASQKTKPEMISIIKKGNAKMPGFENELTGEQIEAVVDYIVALSRM